MPVPERLPSLGLVARSRAHSFVTVWLSDLEGPARRQRSVFRGRPLPEWLRNHWRLFGPGFDCVVAAMGKARLGSQVRVQNIVVYPARLTVPETAYIYVTEREADGRVARDTSPVHVVRCAKLPEVVRFVEVPTPARVPRTFEKVPS